MEISVKYERPFQNLHLNLVQFILSGGFVIRNSLAIQSYIRWPCVQRKTVKDSKLFLLPGLKKVIRLQCRKLFKARTVLVRVASTALQGLYLMMSHSEKKNKAVEVLHVLFKAQKAIVTLWSSLWLSVMTPRALEPKLAFKWAVLDFMILNIVLVPHGYTLLCDTKEGLYFNDLSTWLRLLVFWSLYGGLYTIFSNIYRPWVVSVCVF